MEEQLPNTLQQETNSAVEEPKKKFGAVRLIVLGFVFILVLGALGISSYLLASHSKTISLTQKQLTLQPTPTPNPTANWQTYTDPQNGFSLKYPQNWYIYQYPHTSSIAISDIPNPQDIPTKLPYNPHTIILVTTTLGHFPSSFPYTNGSFGNKTIKTLTFQGHEAISGQTKSTIGVSDVIMAQNNHRYITITREFGGTAIFNAVLSTVVFTSTNHSTTDQPTPTATPEHTYKDSYFGYSIKYPVSWIFRRTYDPDIQKGAPTDVKSGFDLTFNENINGQPMTQAVIVLNVLDRHNAPDIQTWISQYDLNYPKNAKKETINFNNLTAIKYSNFTESDHPTEYIYFLSGNYAYRLQYWESAGISDNTRAIVSTLTP